MKNFIIYVASMTIIFAATSMHGMKHNTKRDRHKKSINSESNASKSSNDKSSSDKNNGDASNSAHKKNRPMGSAHGRHLPSLQGNWKSSDDEQTPLQTQSHRSYYGTDHKKKAVQPKDMLFLARSKKKSDLKRKPKQLDRYASMDHGVDRVIQLILEKHEAQLDSHKTQLEIAHGKANTAEQEKQKHKKIALGSMLVNALGIIYLVLNKFVFDNASHPLSHHQSLMANQTWS